MSILKITVPIFLFLLVGVAGRHMGLIGAETRNFLNKLIYYIGMPCLIFKGIASFDFTDTFRIDMVGHNLLTTGIIFTLSFPLAFFVRNRRARGAFHMAAFRANQGYIGLPVLNGFYGTEAVSRAAVINGFDSPYCVFLSIFSLEIFRSLLHPDADRKKAARLLGRKLLDFLRNPFLIATLLGLACSYWRVPVMQVGIISEFLTMAGNIALPLALLSIGCSIELRRVREGAAALTGALLIRLVLAPAVGFALGYFAFGFRGTELGFTTLLTAMPVSVSSYVMAVEMEADDSFMATVIGLSTFASVVTLSVAQFLLAHFVL